MKLPNPKILLVAFTLTLLNISPAHAFTEEHDLLIAENAGTACIVGGGIGLLTGAKYGMRTAVARTTLGCVGLGAVGAGLVTLDVARDEEELRAQEHLNSEDNRQDQ